MTEKESKSKEDPEAGKQSPYQIQPYVGQYHYYPYKKLYRSTRDKWIAGVCGGLAEYLNKDPVLIRLLWIVLTVFSLGMGVIAYLAFWLLVNKYPCYSQPPVQYTTRDEQGAIHYHYHIRSPE